MVEAGTEASDELAKRETFNCPAGRLMIYDNKTGKNAEPPLEQKIGVIDGRCNAAALCASTAVFLLKVLTDGFMKFATDKLYAAATSRSINLFATGRMPEE